MKKDIDKIKGCLFDMDGLLVDTEKLYNRFWREAAKDYGYEMQYEDALKLRGMGAAFSSRLLKDRFGEEFPYEEIKEHRRKIMQEYVDKEGVEGKDGAKELLEFLKTRGIKTCLATSSPFERAKAFLEQTGIFKYFDDFTCGPEVKSGKPDPDIFLLAAEKLGLAPGECMVLEDSPNGILAAFRAGCLPVMIPDLDEPDEVTEELLFAKKRSLLEVRGLFEGINTSQRILIDADACPVVRIAEKVAKEYEIPVILLCDTNHVLNSDYSEVKIIGAGADAVDFALVNLLKPGDIVISQDYGVAAMALGKKAYAIHQSGKWYTEQNIDQMLAERHLAKEARRKSAKNHLKGPRKRTREDDLRFENQLRLLIDKSRDSSQ